MRLWGNKLSSDAALIKAFAKGSHSAFEVLYLRHKTRLFCFIKRQSSSHEIAEEIAHDAWLAVINQAASYQTKAAFSTWLFRIAHNKLVDYWRKHGGVTSSVIDELSEHLSTTSNPTVEQLEFAQICQCLELLSAEQMEVLLLKIEGFSQSEIAQITNSKQETVKSRLRYARQHLKNSMELPA